MLVGTSLKNIVPKFQRAMLLAAVFVLSVIHSMKRNILLWATAYVKGNHGSISLDFEKKKKIRVPIFVFIYLIS